MEEPEPLEAEEMVPEQLSVFEVHKREKQPRC